MEIFYNGSGFSATIEFLLQNWVSPFELFNQLATCWEKEGYHLVSHKKMVLYTFLYNFAAHLPPVRELLKYDMLCQENIRTFPAWIDEYYQPDNLKITRTRAVHSFEYDVHSYKKMLLTLEFDYSKPVDERVKQC